MDPCLLLLVFGEPFSFLVGPVAGNGMELLLDPVTGLYYVPSASGPIVVQLTEADPSESNLIYRRVGSIRKWSSRITAYKATLWSNNSNRYE